MRYTAFVMIKVRVGGIELQVNISISNMGNLEYPAYVEVDRRSRSYFLYKWSQKLRLTRTR